MEDTSLSHLKNIKKERINAIKNSMQKLTMELIVLLSQVDLDQYDIDFETGKITISAGNDIYITVGYNEFIDYMKVWNNSKLDFPKDLVVGILESEYQSQPR